MVRANYSPICIIAKCLHNCICIHANTSSRMKRVFRGIHIYIFDRYLINYNTIQIHKIRNKWMPNTKNL